MTKYRVADDWWTTPTESENGRRVIVTGRRGIERAKESGKFNDRIEITWKYASDSEGMPDDPTSKTMEAVTDAMLAGFKKEQPAVMTGIYTGDGERNWIFYVRNIQKFQTVLNESLQDFDLLPITLYAERDPQWLEYEEMKELTEIVEE